MASCRRCSLLRMDESNRREPTLTTRPPRISGSTRASMETLAPPSTERSVSLSCCSCCGESGMAEVTLAVSSARRVASSASNAASELGEKGRSERDEVAGAAVGHHGADEIAGQAPDAGGVEHGEQRLALRLVADHRACQQAGELGAFSDQIAECGEVLSDLVKRVGIVCQFEKSVGIAAGNV